MEGKRKGDLKILAHHSYFFFSSFFFSSSFFPFFTGGPMYIYLKNTLYVYRSIFKVSKSDHGEYDID
jgi:hypothetical protein